MSQRRTDAEFGEHWRKLCRSKTRETPGDSSAAAAMCRDLQSPQRRGCRRYPGVNNGDSPGDVESSQDIFWDSTSPNAGSGLRNNRVVEISDIVNRIVPMDVKPKGTESPLLQWIGDSAVSCTPEIPKPRARKMSCRQSSVEDLKKLARQFDENLQQDIETTEQLNTITNNVDERASSSDTTPTLFPGKVDNLKCPSSVDQAEAELHALFDSSTQKVSGRLSQGSLTSASSQEKKPVTSTAAEPRQSEPESAEKSGSALHPAEGTGSCGNGLSNCDDFDDDWENDDLLNDSIVLEMTQSSDRQHNTNFKTSLQSDTKTNTPQCTSVCKPTASIHSSHSISNWHFKPSRSSLQELCPKPKSTNRSTFKLEPNPPFQPTAAKQVSKSSFTVQQPKLQMSERKSAETLSIPQPGKITSDQKGTYAAADSVKDISDSLWDDGADDALLYQVCDRVERISSSQPLRAGLGGCQEKQDVDAQRKSTAPLPIDAAWSASAVASAHRQTPGSFVRSNSLPGTSCETVNYQGSYVPMKGANCGAMPHILPGSHVNPGTFRDAGTFQAVKPHMVTATPAHISRTHHTAFKRHVSDSAVMSSKVFVTSQMMGKCSAAEIERKKQEALARRRLRMQNAPNLKQLHSD